MAVFQTLLPLQWQAALALENLLNSRLVIVLYFSVVLPFLFLCLAILVYLFCLKMFNVWMPHSSDTTICTIVTAAQRMS